jgi:hypothetical protein
MLVESKEKTMNDTLIANDIKEAAAKFLTAAAKPSVAAQALSELCQEYAQSMRRFPGAEAFWNKIGKSFGVMQLNAFIAEREFAKKSKK